MLVSAPAKPHRGRSRPWLPSQCCDPMGGADCVPSGARFRNSPIAQWLLGVRAGQARPAPRAAWRQAPRTRKPDASSPVNSSAWARFLTMRMMVTRDDLMGHGACRSRRRLRARFLPVQVDREKSAISDRESGKLHCAAGVHWKPLSAANLGMRGLALSARRERGRFHDGDRQGTARDVSPVATQVANSQNQIRPAIRGRWFCSRRSKTGEARGRFAKSDRS